MTNTNQTPTPNKTDSSENNDKLYAKIKETWPKMGDDDIKLYTGKRDQFFVKLKEKQNMSKEDAEKKLQELEKALGASANTKAA